MILATADRQRVVAIRDEEVRREDVAVLLPKTRLLELRQVFRENHGEADVRQDPGEVLAEFVYAVLRS